MIGLALIACMAIGIGAWSAESSPKAKAEEHKHEEGEEGHSDYEKSGEHAKADGHTDKDEHGEGEKHAEGEKPDEHGHGGGGHGGGHEEEGGSAVGPDKGIVESGERGMKLSAEAVATIKPATIPWQAGSFVIPYDGLVRIKESKSVFRLRDGFYKRVPAIVESRDGDKVRVRVEGLNAGDQIVVSQAGFLRIAEVIQTEGAAHHH